MNRIIFILGGARSGKSAFAVSLAKNYKKVTFIATCQPRDKEMHERIRLHKEARPKSWKTFEEPKDIEGLLGGMGDEPDCVIIDCLTLLVSNLILAGHKEEDILKKFKAIAANLRKKKAKIIIVSNEVGLGIVPANRLGRGFRDIAGRVNQMAAKIADEVLFIVSGVPLKIKGEK